jgi:hypothetical protein
MAAKLAMGEICELAAVLLEQVLTYSRFAGSAECKKGLNQIGCCGWILRHAMVTALRGRFGAVPSAIPATAEPRLIQWTATTPYVSKQTEWTVVMTYAQQRADGPYADESIVETVTKSVGSCAGTSVSSRTLLGNLDTPDRVDVTILVPLKCLPGDFVDELEEEEPFHFVGDTDMSPLLEFTLPGAGGEE